MGVCIERDSFFDDYKVLCKGCTAVLGGVPRDDFRMVLNPCFCDPSLGPEPCIYGAAGHGKRHDFRGDDVAIPRSCPDCGASTDCDGVFERALEHAEPGKAPPESVWFKYSCEDGVLFISPMSGAADS